METLMATDGDGARPRPAQADMETLIAQLRDRFGQRASTSLAVREQHAKGFSFHEVMPADIVVTAQSESEVAEIVTSAAAVDAPVIAYGTGTCIEGQLAALSGGVCIDMGEMNNIIELNAEDMDVTVEPGVTRKQLNEHLRDTGLFFPIDPGADASLGGMAATRASGTNAVRYGTMRENVLGLRVVLPDGRIIHTGGRARKSSAGYDLTRLFVGSEGTLGMITAITLRLYGIPEAISSAVVEFDDMKGAVNAVIATIQWGIPIARIEFMDEVQMDAVNRYSKLNYCLKPTLFLEFHGSEVGVREQSERMSEICSEFGGGEFQWTTDAEESKRLWQARHDVAFACVALRPGSQAMATDVCVPISSLAECVMETRKDIDEEGIVAPIVGHVGDGNFHVAFLIGPDDRAGDLAVANRVNKKLVERAIAMGGTSTGEHGVGQGKMAYMDMEHGDAMDVMRALKIALDPKNIMNPGKIFTL